MICETLAVRSHGRTRLGLALGLLLLLLAPPVQAATYYVSPTGNDTTGDGTIGTPWETVQTGCDALAAGDTLVIQDGTYRTAQTCHDVPGTAESPVVVRAATEHGAVFSTAVDIDTWTNTTGNIWASDDDGGIASATGIVLWKVGENTGYVQETVESNLSANREFWYDATNDLFKIYSTTDPNSASWKGWGSGFTGFSARNVQSVTFQDLKAEYNNVGMLFGSGGTVCDTGTLNIVVDNAWSRWASHWAAAAISDDDCLTTNPEIKNSLFEYTDRINAAESTHNGHCFKFAANIAGAGGTGANFHDNLVHDCDQQAVQHSVGWAEGRFYNNEVYHYGLRSSGSASGFSCNWGTATAGGCDIYNNIIHGGTNDIGTGIYVQGGANDVHIYGNRIYDNDWHGIYVFNNAGNKDIWIYNNLIYDNRTAGIRIEQASGSSYILNNTFYDNGTAPLFGHGAGINWNNNSGDGFTVFNNIFYQIDSYAHSNASFTTAIYHDFGNLYYRSDGGDVIHYNGTDYTLAEYQAATANDGLPNGTQSLEADPLLTDPGAGDFTLQSTSPAKRLAVFYKEDVLTHDFDGDPRGVVWDMGAYEASGELSVTGVRLEGVSTGP